MPRVSLPSRAFNDRRIRGCHLRVLAALAMLGAGSLSQKEIGSECGITGRDLRRELQELVDYEYLSIEVKDGTKSVYTIEYNDIEGGDKSSPTGEEKLHPPRLVVVPPDVPPPFSPAPLNPPPLNPPSPQKQARARARASRLPMDWKPSPQNLAYAEGHGFRARMLTALVVDFCDYWHARAGPNALKVDWSKTWARWVRTAAERKDAKHGRQSAHDAETAAFAWVVGADDSGSDREDDAPLLDAAGAV